MSNQAFTTEFFQEQVIDALTNVFTTMLSCEITFQKALDCGNIDKSVRRGPVIVTDKPIVSASVGFTGSVNGMMYLSMGESLAQDLTGSFLGLELEEVQAEGDETVNDALGELANMSVGNFKNKLCDKGFNCVLTLPSILRGNNISIESNIDEDIRRYIYHFETFGKPLVVDLIFKPETLE